MSMPSHKQEVDTHTPIAIPSSVSLPQCLSYALPAVAMLWMHAPLVIVQGIYAKYYGVSLSAIALILLLGRIVDAVSDPLIGYYSDRYRRRTGTRKPFVLAGGLLMIISGYCLYVPISASTGYFAVCLLAFYLSYTLFDIPHNAWASDVAASSSDKNRIFSCRSAAVFAGLTLFYIVPLLPIFESRDITPETLKVSIIAAGLLMLVSLWLSIKYTPSGHQVPANASPAASRFIPWPEKIQQLGTSLRVYLSNAPLSFFYSSYLFYGLGYGMWLGLIFLFVDGYLGLGEFFAQVFLLAYIAGILVTPLWCKLASLFGRAAMLSASLLLLMASFIYTSFLQPAETSLSQLLLLKVINTLGASGMMALAPALLSTIIDYSHWKNRREQTATYFAFYVFIHKAGLAIGVALSLAIADGFGFDATSTTQSADSRLGLVLGMTVLPVLCLIPAVLLMAFNPLTDRRHSIVRHRLNTPITDNQIMGTDVEPTAKNFSKEGAICKAAN